MKTLDIYKCVNYLSLFNKVDLDINKIVIDTRKVENNDCYIGIKGENHDGNLLFMEAFQKGASLVILDNFQITEDIKKYLVENNKSIVVVKSSIKALGVIAKVKRESFFSPVVSITGSAGKTSTKDMVYSVLNESFNAHKTIGNQNNHIGLPLTILGLEENNEVLVLEMGMNHLREISYLTNIAKPDVAVITNVGTAHIGNLGSRENILKAKLEILEGLNPNGTLIINNDNDLLHNWYINNNTEFNIITIGIRNESMIMAENIKELEDSSTFVYDNNVYKVPVAGLHFIYNALVSIAVAKCFKVPIPAIQEGILNFRLSSNRMDIINTNNPKLTIIDDSYNANYDSMSYALKYLGSLRGRNIAVLGTMMELGKFSKKLHEDIGLLVNSEEIDILITVGSDSKYINEMAIQEGFNKTNSYHFEKNDDAIKLINKIKQDGDNILVKASNSLNFKEIVEKLKD